MIKKKTTLILTIILSSCSSNIKQVSLSTILFGKESSGLPHNILNKYQDRCIRIPIDFASRSLNLSNCVAIILSEVARQQNFFSLSIKEEIKTPDYIKKKDR